MPMSTKEVKEEEFEKVWISYGDDPHDGERGVILFGKLYSVETLLGAGLQEIFEDVVTGEDIEYPSGNYKLYRA